MPETEGQSTNKTYSSLTSFNNGSLMEVGSLTKYKALLILSYCYIIFFAFFTRCVFQER